MVNNSHKAPSGQTIVLVCVMSFFACVAFTLLGFTFSTMLNTTPAWFGPALIATSILFGLVGVYSVPKAVRYFVSKQGNL